MCKSRPGHQTAMCAPTQVLNMWLVACMSLGQKKKKLQCCSILCGSGPTTVFLGRFNQIFEVYQMIFLSLKDPSLSLSQMDFAPIVKLLFFPIRVPLKAQHKQTPPLPQRGRPPLKGIQRAFMCKPTLWIKHLCQTVGFHQCLPVRHYVYTVRSLGLSEVFKENSLLRSNCLFGYRCIFTCL